MKSKHGSYTEIADIMLVASRPESTFVRDDIPDIAAIGVTACFHPGIQRQHQQHAEDLNGRHSHGEVLSIDEN